MDLEKINRWLEHRWGVDVEIIVILLVEACGAIGIGYVLAHFFAKYW